MSPLPLVASIEYVETLIVSTSIGKGSVVEHRYKIDLVSYPIDPVNPNDTVAYSPVMKYSTDDVNGGMKCDPSSTQFCPADICEQKNDGTQCKKVIATIETDARMMKALTNSCSSPLTRSVGSDTSKYSLS